MPQLGGNMNSLYLLLSLDPATLGLLFWFTLIFDLPRYVISLAVVAILERKELPPVGFTTSAIVAGHNEAATIRACVESIDADQIIVVDDGSTDGMWSVVERLRSEGLVHKAIRLPIRSSKVTAINMALANCIGEIVFIIDANTILEPGAIDATLPYFADPAKKPGNKKIYSVIFVPPISVQTKTPPEAGLVHLPSAYLDNPGIRGGARGRPCHLGWHGFTSPVLRM